LNPEPDVICPKCGSPDISISSRTYFFECGTCGWKGIRPKFTKIQPSYHAPIGRALVSVAIFFAISGALSAVGLAFRLPQDNTALLALISIAAYSSYFVYYFWNTPDTKWRLGKMNETEIDLLNLEELARLRFESDKMIRAMKKGWTVILPVCACLIALAFVLHSIIVEGFALLFITAASSTTPIFAHQYRKLKDQSKRLGARISRIEGRSGG